VPLHKPLTYATPAAIKFEHLLNRFEKIKTANNMNNAIVLDCKSFVNAGDLKGLQQYYETMIHTDYSGYSPNWQYIYQQVYLHACLKKKLDIVNWLSTLFGTFDTVAQIALRQMFPYGRHLLAR